MNRNNPAERREVCVLDTCATLSSLTTMVEGQTLLHWMSRLFWIYISKEVDKEVKRNITDVGLDEEFYRSNIDELASLGRLKVRNGHPECLRIIRSEIVSSPFTQKLEPGEIQSSALALKLSRQGKRHHIVLISDDSDASQVIELVFRRQKVGCLMSTADSLIYIYARKAPTIHLSEVKTALETLSENIDEKAKGLAPLFRRNEHKQILDRICVNRCKRRGCMRYFSRIGQS